MKIFIDFDDTIFYTKKFKHDLMGIFRRYGVREEEYRNSYYTFSAKSRFQGRHYDIDAQIKALERNNKIDGARLKMAVDKFMADLSVYLFSDVEFFLKKFTKKDLFILSYGQFKFQKIKIKGTGIEKSVHKISITKRKKTEVILELARKYAFSKKEAIILIDDHPGQFELNKKAKARITTFHLSRREGRYRGLPCLACDYAVKNLREAARIIKKEKL